MQYVEFDETNLQSFEINKTISSDKNIIGTCELGTAELQLLNDSNEYSNFKDKWIKTIHGSFYIYDVKPVQERVNIKLSCYDIKYLLDIKYEQNQFEDIFPCNIATWRNKIAERYGIKFNDNDNFPFADLMLNKHPYVGEDVSVRDVMKQISQACVSYIDTDANDFFYFSWFDFSNPITIEDWLDLTTEKKATDKVNVAVLGRGDVEDIASYPTPAPENPKEFRIDNNYILDPQEADGVDNRAELVKTVYARVKDFKYIVYSMRTQSATNVFDIKLGSSIKYVDIWGNKLESVVMSIKLNWLGGNLEDSENYEITISAEEISETSSEFSYSKSVEDIAKDARVTANKAQAEVSAKVSKGEVITEINLTPGNATINSDKISLKGKIIDLTSDIIKIIAKNFSVDEYGNLKCNNAEITGGKIVLEDSGTEETSALIIKTEFIDEQSIEDVTELSGATISLNFPDDLDLNLDGIKIGQEYPILYSDNDNYLYVMKERIGVAVLIGFDYYIIDSKSGTVLFNRADYLDGSGNIDYSSSTNKLNEFTFSDDWGSVTSEQFDYFEELWKNIKYVKKETRNTYYTGRGIIADLTTDADYTIDDVYFVQNYIVSNSSKPGSVVLTPQQIRKYDANKDGVVDLRDILRMQKYVMSGISKSKPGKFILNTDTLRDNLQIIDGDGNDVVSIGLNGINFRTQPNYRTNYNLVNLSSALSFSSDEKMVSTWIDGKPVYRRVIELPAWDDTDYSVVHSEFVSDNIDTLIKLEGFILNQWNSWCPINWPYNKGASAISAHITASGDVEIRSGYQCVKGYVIVEYTKVDD